MGINKKNYFDFKLKSGQTVVTSYNDRYVIVFRESENIFWAIDETGTHLGSVREGLIENHGNKDYSCQIIKVYDCSPFFSRNLIDSDLVWKIEDEETVKELTLQEVADKFGISIDKLRIKD